MSLASKDMRSGQVGYLRASKYFSVPKGTLDRYVKDTFRFSEEQGNVHLGITLVVPNGLENELVQYCLTMDQKYCALRH
jgi:hypothetical protein